MRKWTCLVLLVALAAVLVHPLANALTAVRLAIALRGLASGETGQTLPVLVEKVSRPDESRPLEGMLFRPLDSAPTRALIMVAGITELGCYHPRLMALARILADEGFLVFSPDIRAFREFRISPEAMDEIAFWLNQLTSLQGSENVRQVGLCGVSFSGTLALITAARPEFRDRVAYVLAIGAYYDALACTQGWFAAGPVTVGPGYYPTRFYAKWVMMLAALEMLPQEKERRFIHAVLESLLLQKDIPELPPDLSPEAERWHRFAVMPEDQSDPELAREIVEYLTPILYGKINPEQALREVRCPVFLVHGTYDDLIPPEESRRLQKQVVGAKTHLLISPFLTHTHPMEKPLSSKEEVLATADILSFFYQLARVIRDDSRTPFR